MSLPTWECGLKQCRKRTLHRYVGHSPRGSVDWNLKGVQSIPMVGVTPHVGVWIETLAFCDRQARHLSLPTWECGLKHYKAVENLVINESLPTWECGLKQVKERITEVQTMSLPTWECGLKPLKEGNYSNRSSHSPRGSVDWNWSVYLSAFRSAVTPHVGVWIETTIRAITTCLGSHSPRGSVDWNVFLYDKTRVGGRHSPRGSVDWNSTLQWNICPAVARHSPRESVDWNVRKGTQILMEESLPTWECGLKLNSLFGGNIVSNCFRCNPSATIVPLFLSNAATIFLSMMNSISFVLYSLLHTSVHSSSDRQPWLTLCFVVYDKGRIVWHRTQSIIIIFKTNKTPWLIIMS